MKIKIYIKDLLTENQGVIIPGLGGFISEYEPAEFDINENRFLPPTKKITFKPEFSYKDNLLTDYISKKEGIENEKSNSLLNEFVNEIHDKFKKGGKVEFPEIGTLNQIAKGKIQFTQNKDSNLLSESFGLKGFNTNPLKPQDTSEILRNPGKPKRQLKKLIAIYSSVLCFILVIAFGWILTNGYTDFKILPSSDKPELKSAENLIKINTQRQLDSIAKEDSVKALINESIDENTDLKDALFYEEPVKEDPKAKYSEFQIIAGSFKNTENAEIFSTKLKDKGYDSKVIQSGENLFRIVIFTFTDETEALKELYKLRESSDLKSVWILKSL